MSRFRMSMLGCLSALFPAAAVSGHVVFDSPNGGETFVVGSVVTVQWHIAIAHNLQNWDLWYSTTSENGPWTTIEMNVPAGSGAVGVPHFYLWTVPAVVDDSVWLRVRMDNSATDYYDTTDSPFAIVSEPGDVNGDGTVDVSDLVLVILNWGVCEAPPCAGDVNGDDVIDVLDLVAVILAWG